jgi:predicted Ser/Thr protein kinase
MIEHPSDHNDSENQNDNINNQRSRFLTRQFVTFDDNWMMKNSKNPSKFSKSLNQGEATLLDTEPDEIQIVSLFTQISQLKSSKKVAYYQTRIYDFFYYSLLPQSIWLITIKNQIALIHFHQTNLT